VVARCEVLDVPLAAALAGTPRLVAVLVDANDPGNAGTVVRLADAAGADAVVFAGDSVDAFNPKVVRASTGSIFHLPLTRASRDELLAALAAAGLTAIATTGAADLELPQAAEDGLLELPTAWVFGSEAHGLPDDLLEGADQTIRVPIYGRAESLNLATAAALCLYASATAQRRARTLLSADPSAERHRRGLSAGRRSIDHHSHADMANSRTRPVDRIQVSGRPGSRSAWSRIPASTMSVTMTTSTWMRSRTVTHRESTSTSATALPRQKTAPRTLLVSGVSAHGQMLAIRLGSA
jgi:TrmH family RNA methyltransferase